MRNSSGGRNMRDIAQQNYMDVTNYASMFKTPITTKTKIQKLALQNQKLPSFNKKDIAQSTPNSPKDNSFWKTNNGFYQNVNYQQFNDVQYSSIKQKIETKDSKYHSRNSVSPQIYALNRSLVAGEKRVSLPANSRKYHLQMQIFNDQLMQSQQGTYRNSVKKDESLDNQLMSPNVRHKGLRNSLHARTNSRVIEDQRTLHNTQKSQVESGKNETQNILVEIINKNCFKFQYVLGKGGFGKVWRVELAKEKKSFAMKEMSKAKIMAKKSVNSVMNERLILASLRHPFIANIHFAYQDRENLYLVMDLLTGGDLRFHIGRQRRFSESQTKFLIACMLLSLEYLHKNNIIHRDIKPENIVLDKKGYPRLTDFGIARIVKPENSQETSGTPGYMAPEVMCRQNHSFGVDHYALGVMTFEFMMGRRPYVGRSRREIRDAILAKQVQLKKSEIPLGWSPEAADFVNQMIQRKPQSRLGFGGIEEIQSHSWFSGYQWKALYDKQLPSPFYIQHKQEDLDYQREVSSDHDSQDQAIQENSILLRKDSIQDLFQNYEYNDKYIITGSTNTTQVNFDKRNKSREYKQ